MILKTNYKISTQKATNNTKSYKITKRNDTIIKDQRN